MYSFFVLGLIPGTNFQITFQLWLDGMLLVIEAWGVVWLHRRHREVVIRYLPPGLLVVSQFYYTRYLNLLTELKAFLVSQATTWN